MLLMFRSLVVFAYVNCGILFTVVWLLVEFPYSFDDFILDFTCLLVSMWTRSALALRVRRLFKYVCIKLIYSSNYANSYYACKPFKCFHYSSVYLTRYKYARYVLKHFIWVVFVVFSLCDVAEWGDWGDCERSCNSRRIRYRILCCSDSDTVACLSNCGRKVEQDMQKKRCSHLCVYGTLGGAHGDKCICESYSYGDCCENRKY